MDSNFDERAGLINDDDVDADENEIYSSQQDTTIPRGELGVQLSLDKSNIYSGNSILNGSFTLREMNSLYGNSGGCKYGDSDVPELDRCVTKGCISPMTRFDNIIGHFAQDIPYANMNGPYVICLEPEISSDFNELSETLSDSLGPTLRRGRLWSLQGFYLCRKDENESWIFRNELLSEELASIFDVISISFSCPLSVHSQHAWMEFDDFRDVAYTFGIFKQPEETTAVTGLLGTLQNNQLVDMTPYEPDEIPNLEFRSKSMDVPGFLCRGHTSHSTEAGRVRRTCCDVSVRILNKQLVEMTCKGLEVAARQNVGVKNWTLFVMGKVVRCTEKSLITLRNFLRSSSSLTLQTSTLEINRETKCAIISMSSGVLLRRDNTGSVISSMSLYSDPWKDETKRVSLPSETSAEKMRFYFSGFFQLIPYIAFDRPPRTVISSVQSQQAVVSPFGAGTSSIAPSHVSKPLVSTEMLEDIINDESSGIPDFVPGEDLLVCFANLNDTYEDSIILSSGSAARGLFSHMAYSSYVINSDEPIPPDGEYADIKVNKWWKSYSRRSVNTPTINGKKPLLAGGDGRGKVVSREITQTGDISVKMLRYSTPATGDKLATGHGQKGVLKLWKEEDMIWGVDKNGEPIKFDMVMSLSSITNRLTEGQYYEMVSGTIAASEGRRLVISPSGHQTMHAETILYDGRSGQMIDRTSEEGDIPVLASWGICRVWQMSQLTWDKQHYTHNTAGRYSVATPTGRSSGGGVKFGEMESHAAMESGLTEAVREIRQRMDLIDVEMCLKCKSILQICICGNERTTVKVSIPHSMLVFDYSNIITSGYANKYHFNF